MIRAIKRALTHHVPMIVGPAPDFGVEFVNQIGGRLTQRSFDRSSDATQEGLDIFLGGLDEQFPVGVSAHVLSEEVKALLHVCNDCLCRREFKSSFLQKLLDEGFDLFLQ